MTEFPRTARALKEALEAVGERPRRRHGQCFLCDAQAVDAVVRDAEVAPGDHVIEVGTGTGLLTHALAEAGAEVDTFDVDARLQAFAVGLRRWPDRVRFHAKDVLDGKHALSPALLAALDRARAAGGPVRCVSNLPYHVATPILLGLLSLPHPPDTVVAMAQLEVAEKLLAAPDDEAYGAPSALRALLATGRILRRFPPQVFWPTPKVRSALLRLVPRADRPLAPADARPFGDFLLALFGQRRKVLTTALRVARPDLDADAAAAACARAGVDPRERPERSTPEALLRLFLAARAPGGPVGGGAPA